MKGNQGENLFTTQQNKPPNACVSILTHASSSIGIIRHSIEPKQEPMGF